MIQRIEYLGRLAKLRDKQTVKVLSGIRGCGKTTLLAMYIDWLKRSGVEDRQIIYINMEEPESESLLNYQGLYSYIKKRLCADKTAYVFIDEIHRCANYNKAIEGLFIRNRPGNAGSRNSTGIDLYIAASNDCIISGIPYIEIKMLPLSFTEYRVFSRAGVPGREEELKEFSKHALQRKTPEEVPGRRLPRQKALLEKYLGREAFNNYLSFGGFPFAAAMGADARLLKNCVGGIYNTVLVKDTASRAGINDIPLLEHIAKLMGGFIGSPLSTKKLSTAIGTKGRKISINTVEMYINALTAAFVFYHAGRFDIKTGKRLKTLGKYYIADTGIRNLLLENATPDLGGQLENIVYLELLYRGFDVCIGKYGISEVNFVVMENSGENRKTAYFQVANSVRDASVLDAKLFPLKRIQDNHPKYILSMDETPFRSNHGGIIQQNLIDWLLDVKK